MRMILSEKTDRFEWTPLRLVMLFAILQLLVAFLTDGSGFSFDEAIWHYIGRNWFRYGLVPYSGGIDNKSPLIFGIFGLSDYLFGVQYWFPRLLGILVQSAGLYFTYKIAKQLAGRQAGILAIILYGLSLLWRSTGGKFVSLTETYSTAFIIISFYRYFTAQKGKDFFISGLIAGLGFGFRLSAGFSLLAIFISSIRKSRADTIRFSSGVLLSIILLLALSSLAGIHFHDLVTYLFTDNFGAGSVTDHTVRWRLESFMNGFFYSELILFYPGLIGYFFIKKRTDCLIIWLICAFIGINVIGMYARTHFKEILPPLAIISAISISCLISTYTVAVKPVMMIIWITFFPKILEPLIGLKRLLVAEPDRSERHWKEPYQEDEDSKRKLGLWIKSSTLRKEQVLVAGYGAQVQVYSERLSPSVYFNVTQTARAKARFFHDVILNKPAMIAVPVFSQYQQLVSRDIRSFIEGLLVKNYYFYRYEYGYNIYRIKNIRQSPAVEGAGNKRILYRYRSYEYLTFF